jgi:hypothetical protein
MDYTVTDGNCHPSFCCGDVIFVKFTKVAIFADGYVELEISSNDVT